MSYAVEAIYENGVLRPLGKLDLGEHQQVHLIIEASPAPEHRGSAYNDPLDGVRCATGIPDLAEHFDDYRLGHHNP